VSLLAFAAIAVGGAGAVWGGRAAGRLGYTRVVNLAMAVSGACSLAIGALFGRSLWLLAPVVLVWGFFVVADSAQFSAMVTELSPSHAVGTALTLQTSLGFLLTMVTIQLIPVLVEHVGWAFASVPPPESPRFAGSGIGSRPQLASEQCVPPTEIHCL
jgi:MFS family permease